MEEENSSSIPIYRLPLETLHQIFSILPLKQITICKTLSKFFNEALTSSPFLRLHSSSHSPLSLLSLRSKPNHNYHHLEALDPLCNRLLTFDLSFLPFLSPSPVASCRGLLFLWAEPPMNQSLIQPSDPAAKSLVVCNPVTRKYRVLPQLGSAWSKHGSVLVNAPDKVLVLTELATLYLSPDLDHWLNFSSNLPAKPRSPILVKDCIYTLCNVGSPWRSQWKLYSCPVIAAKPLSDSSQMWSTLEMWKWGDVLKRPKLVVGDGNSLFMIGGRSLRAPYCSIVVVRLNLATLEWSEAARMPAEMFTHFQESRKFKVFGGGNCVCFSKKTVGKLALWQGGANAASYEEGNKDDEWRWIEGLPGNRDVGTCRGFIFEASLHDLP